MKTSSRGVRKVNPKRRAKEWARAYGSKERVEWLKAQPSVVSGKTPCENVHVLTGGIGRKAHYSNIVAMTRAEHREMHLYGVRTFAAKYSINLDKAAAETQQKWLEFSGESA